MVKKKIMVVDDEESLRSLMKDLLESEGYETILVENGKEALMKLTKEKPDLILLDMMMPGMSGREVCEKIRANEKTKGLKVAFLTVVSFSESGLQKLKDMGVVDYIQKPFKNDDLLKRIKKLIKS